MDVRTLRTDPERSRTALLMSLLALAVPVAGSALAPELVRTEAGVLLWILPLLPAFLLSYYHGWKGASVALAGGMATLAIAESILMLAGRGAPSPVVLLGTVASLIAVALGSGWLSELFRTALEKARRDALFDAGSGAPNRRAVMMALERAFHAAQRGGALSVVIFDLDHFKSINDEYGHAVGDEVLRIFAGILREHTRAMNISGRYGGEEFLSVVEQSDVEGAYVFAERVRKALEQAALPAEGVTVSAGVAEFEAGMSGPDVLVAAADQALYRAKNAGRNRVEVMRPSGRAEPPVRPPDAEPPSLRGSGQRILVVDDEPDVRGVLARALERFGYEVHEAVSAHQALKVAREVRLDLVVSDIVMPDVHGFRLVEMLMEVVPGLRAVYISGYGPDDMEWGGVPGAAWAFLGKPVDLDQLAAVVAEVLARPVPPPSEPDVASQEPAEVQGPSMDDHDAPDPALTPMDPWDEAVLGARVVVLDPLSLSMIPTALRNAGFWNVARVESLDDIADDLPLDLLAADLSTCRESPERLSRVTRHEEGRSPAALLLLSSRASRIRDRHVRRLGLVEVLDRPVDSLLVASTARNLLRIRALREALESGRTPAGVGGRRPGTSP